MTKHPLRLDHYLIHINQAIDRIESYIKDCDQLAFISNTMIQDAVISLLNPWLASEVCFIVIS
jgi:uncharacterized protein with HEPN domain